MKLPLQILSILVLTIAMPTEAARLTDVADAFDVYKVGDESASTHLMPTSTSTSASNNQVGLSHVKQVREVKLLSAARVTQKVVYLWMN